VDLKDARRHRVLDSIVYLLCCHAAGRGPTENGDLLIFRLGERVNEASRALDRSVLAIEAADDLDVVLKPRSFGAAVLKDVALPVVY
jgi:hypothetical protein